jgi:hypothetical protein
MNLFVIFGDNVHEEFVLRFFINEIFVIQQRKLKMETHKKYFKAKNES